MTSEPEPVGFVIWVDRPSETASRLCGLVECVRSAERARFDGAEQLVTLIEAWAASVDTRANAACDPRNR